MSNIQKITPRQKKIINGSILNTDKADMDEQQVTYSHSTLCQTSLPFKNMKEVREWKNRNGNAFVLLEAGQVYDSRIDDTIKLGLPYGAKPRLILNHLNRLAVIHQSPVIEVENTLRAFMLRIGVDVNGRSYASVKDQLSRLAASSMTIGRMEFDGSSSTVYGRVIDKQNLFFNHNEKQQLLWPNAIELSENYFNSLMTHAVPLDENAIGLLRDSALEIDLYTMLAERLHRIDPSKPQFIPWQRLYEQYGNGYGRIRAFRNSFIGHLKNVHVAYRKARIDEKKDGRGVSKGIELFHSQPPVIKKNLVYIR